MLTFTLPSSAEATGHAYTFFSQCLLYIVHRLNHFISHVMSLTIRWIFGILLRAYTWCSHLNDPQNPKTQQQTNQVLRFQIKSSKRKVKIHSWAKKNENRRNETKNKRIHTNREHFFHFVRNFTMLNGIDFIQTVKLILFQRTKNAHGIFSSIFNYLAWTFRVGCKKEKKNDRLRSYWNSFILKRKKMGNFMCLINEKHCHTQRNFSTNRRKNGTMKTHTHTVPTQMQIKRTNRSFKIDKWLNKKRFRM